MSVDLTQIVLRLGAIVPSIVLHEVAHGAVADHYGDHTARRAGRLTLNPVSHVDPFGTLLLPFVLAASGLPMFGYAKPVPVNVNNLRKPRNQSIAVSLAGPAVNILLAAVAWVVCWIYIHHDPTVNFNVLLFFVYLGIGNVTLAALNLLPIPPLDGSALIERLVPRQHLGTYFRIRGQMLPFVILLFIVSSAVFHWSPFTPLTNWWLRSAGFAV